MIHGRLICRLTRVCIFLILFITIVQCGSQQDSENLDNHSAPGSILLPGTDEQSGNQGTVPVKTNPDDLLVSVKYVALKSNQNSSTSTTIEKVQSLMQNMSQVWSQCGILFTLEKFQIVAANDYNIAFNPSSFFQLDQIRTAFEESTTALYVATGSWIHTGELGSSNGYSSVPNNGNSPEGVVLEDYVSLSKLLVSHETGHLIGGLDHVTTNTNLMNHLVGSSNTVLTSSQCTAARQTLQKYHSSWLR